MMIEIEGRQVEVDDSFLKLSPEQQNATVDEIAASLGPAPQQAQQPQTQLGADRAQANDAQAYNQQPWYSQALKAGQDVGRLLESGASMGFADKMRAVSSPSSQDTTMGKISAGINYINPINALSAAAVNTFMGGDETYKDNLAKERDQTQGARDRAASAALPAEIAGAVISGSTMANAGATLAGRLGTANMTGIKGVLARAGLMAPEGAVYGAVDALGNDKDVATGATIGAIAGPLGSVVGDTVSKVASKVLPAKAASKVPSLEKMHKEAEDAYTASEKAGLIIKPEVMQRVRSNVQQKLTDFGYHPRNHPAVAVALEELERVAQGNITLKGVDIARRVARRGVKPTEPEQTAALQIVIDEIDNAVAGLGSKDIIVGDPRQGVNALLKAREMWTRVKKNERFMDAVNSAKLQAESTHSGGNVENRTRQLLRPMIDPKVKSRPKNWTPDEAAAIKGIVSGSLGQNTLRLLGKIAPQGNGLNLLLHLGGASATGGATLPLAAGGMMAKYAADRGVRQAVQQLDELIRVGGSMKDLQAAQASLRSLSQAQREAVARVFQMGLIQSEARQQEPAQ
jgi:hypothetical protein